MIKVDDTHYITFLYYIEEHSDLNNETTLKRFDEQYINYYTSSVVSSFKQFGDYLTKDNYKILKMILSDQRFLSYFYERVKMVKNDPDDMKISMRLYDAYLYHSIITINTIDSESLGKVKLKFGKDYYDDLYEESYEVIVAFIHQMCMEKDMDYLECKEWVLNQ